MYAVRIREWSAACPDGCSGCSHRICRGGGIYIPGLGDEEITECPREALERDPADLHAVIIGIRAWRHWSSGALSSAYPDASEALCDLVLAVDDEVSAYREHQAEQARRDAERRTRSQR